MLEKSLIINFFMRRGCYYVSDYALYDAKITERVRSSSITGLMQDRSLRENKVEPDTCNK